MKEEIRLLEQRLRELEDIIGRLHQCIEEIDIKITGGFYD